VPADGLKRLFAACAGPGFEARRDTALIMLLLDTGARRAEMVGLKLTGLLGLAGPGSSHQGLLDAEQVGVGQRCSVPGSAGSSRLT
jgi:site-specific recombinase XerC